MLPESAYATLIPTALVLSSTCVIRTAMALAALFTDGAHLVTGLDRTGVYATPEHSVDPYHDGAYA